MPRPAERPSGTDTRHDPRPADRSHDADRASSQAANEYDGTPDESFESGSGSSRATTSTNTRGDKARSSSTATRHSLASIGSSASSSSRRPPPSFSSTLYRQPSTALYVVLDSVDARGSGGQQGSPVRRAEPSPGALPRPTRDEQDALTLSRTPSSAKSSLRKVSARSVATAAGSTSERSTPTSAASSETYLEAARPLTPNEARRPASKSLAYESLSRSLPASTHPPQAAAELPHPVLQQQPQPRKRKLSKSFWRRAPSASASANATSGPSSAESDASRASPQRETAKDRLQRSLNAATGRKSRRNDAA